MVVCDGVTASKDASEKHRYAITDVYWQSQLSPQAPTNIRWAQVLPHPGVALYRAGATEAVNQKSVALIVFAGWHPSPI